MSAPLAIDDVKLEHFGTVSDREAATLTIRMRGNADGEVQGTLSVLLEQVDGEARRGKLTQVVLDLQDLYFMNSSCISLLVRWIDGLSRDLPAPRYHIRFVSNPNLRWQKRTLSALGAMGRQVVTIV
jgi:hypothetical protein